MSQLETIVAEIRALSSLDEMTAMFKQIQQSFQYEFFGVVLWRPDQRRDVITAQRHDELELLADHQETQHFCLRRCTPVMPTEVTQQLGCAVNCLLVPIRGIGSETAALVIGLPAKQQAEAQQIAWYWSIVSGYLYESLHRLHRSLLGWAGVSLTEREHDCLCWAARGKTAWEISQIIGISERTVNFHLGNCLKKTQSTNRQQAISRCLSVGLIHLS